MKKRKLEQKAERRISAALRLVMVAILFLLQIAVIFLLSKFLQQRMAIAYSVLEFVAIIAVIAILSRTGDQTYKYGWVMLILAIPVVGLILYMLWGNTQSKKLDLKNLPYPPEAIAERETTRINVEKLRKENAQWGRLASYLDRAGFGLYRNSKAYYLPTGEKYIEDLIEQMEMAERFIFMEYFIIGTGEVWDRMLQIFRQKVREGVEVKIIADDFGSMRRLPYTAMDELREIGVEIISFNPVQQYVNRLYFNYRDHRKITSIDGDIAYTGGVNIADEYANYVKRFGYWKDCGVRVEGEGAWGLTREWMRMWLRLGGGLEHDFDYYRPHCIEDYPGFCQSLADGPDSNPTHVAEDVFLQMISGGKHMVYITTPYLAIDETMMKTLCIAGDSGVDVRLVLPGIPDHKLTYMVSQSYLGELMEHHVRVYYYTPGLIHAKSVMVDREVAFIGSVNMDYRSFQLHFECGEIIYNMPCIEGLLEDMLQVMDESHELTVEEWKHRGWLRRLLGTIIRLFAMWL